MTDTGPAGPAGPAPSPPAGHGLLDDKIVVVTAAAGTGIGFATAERCLREGATVVVSDTHERRLGEAADRLSEISGNRPLALRCDVTVEQDVRNLYGSVVAEYGRIDVAVNNAGLGGTTNIVEMSDEQWSSVLDVTLTGTFRCTRAALAHMYERRSGRNRQQRVRPRVACPGGAGALCSGQGGSDGAHTMRGGRGSAIRGPCERGVAEPRDAPVPQPSHIGGGARGAPQQGAVRALRRDMGGRECHCVPGERLLVVHERRDRLGLEPAP